ncbi:CU044_5270 family protein [Planomonospora corallina]|uniref:CU044_5270 family protein n=1 Tax=Planomonospora corallina TaxID=1806052 RepID=A0ABV8IEP5_9ACTN
MEELRAARPAHLAGGPVDPRTRQAELAHAFAQPRQVPRRGGKPMAWGLGLAGAAAAVTAVVLVGGTARGPAPVVSPAASGTVTRPVALSAKEVLLVAATSAERRPAATGDYWHVSSRSRTLQPVDEGFVISIEQESESWVGAREQWGSTRTVAIKPATGADRAAWEKAGSPRELTFAGRKRIPIGERPGKPLTGRTESKEIFWLGRNVTMADLRSLPTDPEALRADLLRFYEGKDTEADVPMGEDAWLFRVTEGLIMSMPVSPEVRAAAFRMLAELPSVTSLGQVTDAAGRTGTAIAIADTSHPKPGDTDRGVVQMRLIIDERSGRALARESVVVEPGGLQAGLEPGTVWNTDTVLEAGWTDEHP